MELATKPSMPGENSSGVAVSTEKALAVRVEQLEKMVEELKSRMPEDRATIVVFSGDLDKVLASFVIATGAAAKAEVGKRR